METGDDATEVESEVDTDSDCILLDMSTDLTHGLTSPQRRDLELFQAASDDTITIDSLPLDVSPSLLAIHNTKPPSTRSASETESLPCDCATTPTPDLKNPKTRGLQMGSANPRVMHSSMDSISLHDSTCMTALAASTPSETQPDSSDHSCAGRREQIEQWLLDNFTIPEEEFTDGCGVIKGLHEMFPLSPVFMPKPEGDPFEAAIQRLTLK